MGEQQQPQQQQQQGQEVIDNEFDPIIWSESEDIRVQDLSGSLIQEALTLIKVSEVKLKTKFITEINERIFYGFCFVIETIDTK